MKYCLWMRHNNDYCCIAPYRISEHLCYLYKECSYIEAISSTTDDSIVLAFNVCSSEVTNKRARFDFFYF